MIKSMITGVMDYCTQPLCAKSEKLFKENMWSVVITAIVSKECSIPPKSIIIPKIIVGVACLLQ